jgi:nucleotide-binding universal stress UspA family protein
MGAYGHSRLRESLIGGPTRDLLRALPGPVLLAH